MAEQTLLDALKELRAYCGRHVDDPRASEDEQVAYDDIAIQLAQILQRYPAAPAVPQPVDREALQDAVGEVWPWDDSDEQVRDLRNDVVDAVLAVLVGESISGVGGS